ncbi:MAG TPA: CDP-alcohol phosphatidyltransferase family protein [Paracoccaceae bacterium]|nr:CDP-alcohol phosphatidyltransferase family protein [Paracoccaceae bacterium]
MLDSAARRLIDPPLDAIGRRLAALGIGADAVTLLGLALGLISAALIAAGLYDLALAFLVGSRIADGLDGAIARAGRSTDFGGYLDITADFLFYGAVPLAFILADPAGNGAAGGFLLASFYVNGATFLGFSALAERHKMKTEVHGKKSLYFSEGLLEGTETILFFVLICLMPANFEFFAWIFGSLCFLTAVMRVLAARRIFGKD